MTRVTRRPIEVLIGAVTLLMIARLALAGESATTISEPAVSGTPAVREVAPPEPSGAPGDVQPAPSIDPGMRVYPHDRMERLTSLQDLPLHWSLSSAGLSTTAFDERLQSLRSPSGPAPAPAEPDRALRFPEIVVTGARSPRPRRTTPDTVSVAAPDLFSGRNVTDVAGAIEQLPGVDIVRYGTSNSVAAVFLRGARANQSVVMQDGRPVNAVGSGDADLARIPAGAIERVEVVRGGAALIHGSGALGGAVNVVTPRPPAESAGSVDARGGSFGSRWMHADAGGPCGPVRWLLSGDESATDGHRRNSQGRGTNVLAKLEAMENPVVSVGFTALDSETGTPGTRPPADPAARSVSQVAFGDGEVSSLIDAQRDARRAVDTAVVYTVCPGHVATIRHFTEFAELDFKYGWVPYDSSTYSYLPPRIATTHTHSDTQGLEAQYQGGPFLAEDVRVTAGAGWRKERLRNTEDSYDTGGGDGPLGVERIRARIEIGSAYLTSSLRPLARFGDLPGISCLDQLTVSFGGRNDRHSRFGAIRNGHVGAALDVGPVVLKTSAGTAFRAPAINDLFWPSTVYDRGNPGLLPERGRSVDWGIERTADGVYARVGGFVRTVRDQIEWAPDAAGVWTPTNIGYVRARGAEAEAVVTRGRFTLSGSLTSIDAIQRQREVAEVTSDPVTFADIPARYEVREHRVSHTPRFISAGTLTMKIKRGTRVGVSVRHTGDRLLHYTDYSNWPLYGTAVKRLPPVTLLGVRISRPLGKGAEAYAGVDNLTDRTYSDRFGGTKDRDYPMPGRTFYAGAKVNW